MESIILALKVRREDLGITQNHLAELAEIGTRTLKSIESGKGNPTLETLSKLMDVLGLVLKVEVRELNFEELGLGTVNK